MQVLDVFERRIKRGIVPGRARPNAFVDEPVYLLNQLFLFRSEAEVHSEMLAMMQSEICTDNIHKPHRYNFIALTPTLSDRHAARRL